MKIIDLRKHETLDDSEVIKAEQRTVEQLHITTSTGYLIVLDIYDMKIVDGARK